MKSNFFKDISIVFSLFNRFLRPYLLSVIFLVILNIFHGFIQASLPLSIAPAVNVILGDNPSPANDIMSITLDNLGPTIISWLHIDSPNFLTVVKVVVVIYLLLTCLMALLRTLAYVLSAFISGKALNDLIISLHKHLLTLPISFFNSKREGDIISRFTNDSAASINLLDTLTRGLLQSLIQALFLVFVLFRTDPFLALATVGIGAGHFLITRSLSGIVKKRTKKVYDFFGRMTAALQESLQNIRVTKCFAAEKFDRERLTQESNSVRDSLFQFRIARYIEEPFRLIADALSVCAMLFLAYYAMNAGELTKSGFGMFVFLASRIVGPISDFSKHFLSIFAVAGSAERLIEIFSIRSSLIDGSAVCKPLRNSIKFVEVKFAHIENHYILNNINLEIRKGEMAAIVGSSGGGKSTLCDLILRLYDPSNGKIYLDNEDIRTFKKETYLKQFGVVPQENLLLNASVKENILYGRHWNRGNYENAISIANASEFINQLQEKDLTQIGDRGVRLSGGQRQRIAIARALYGRPDILILDEATSALDSESERLVQLAIDNAILNMTAIVVAHRLSTVLHANKIILLHNGSIEAYGTHDELIKSSEKYKKLVEMQFRN